MRNIDCDKCGACCQTFPVLVSEADAVREPRVKECGLELPEFLKRPGWDFKLHPLPFLEGCCFLGENKLCTVYETRPDVCRKFEAGTEECAEARARVGLPPLDEWEPEAPS
jgi:Fe-S-cluster containining protein